MNAPFDLVEVEPGRRLHVLVEGPEEAPWVVFDHGAFGTYADGWWIKEALKTDHRVVLYGRAGMDWSDPAPEGAPTPAFHIADLKRLLARLGGRAPYILVGHSMAGLRLHAFANLHPDELAGRVFIDAMNPKFLRQKDGMRALKSFAALLQLGRLASKTGVLNAAAPFAGDDIDLPRERRTEKRFLFRQTQRWVAALAEVAAIDPMADYFDPAVTVNSPVSVFSCMADGGENANIVKSVSNQGGYGRLFGLEGETRTSLLNPAHAARIAREVRYMTRTMIPLRAPLSSDTSIRDQTEIGNQGFSTR
ncbi:alpha/beta fold hydrolase [Hyphomonas sp. BRH_c22]|uniref:alpha/beta fold hydrolase n=1 Tax=Hyphomonas sp. BRH_c22 TaxID=1629710 RepID=UPI000A714E58|nr:alpha/beta fold hydrolase [Hyphomonas sp. BRH_c22]